MKSLAVVAASPSAVVPAEIACPACSTIPVATRFTRATGDCVRDERLVEERFVDELLLALLLPRLLAVLLPLLLALFPAPLRVELLRPDALLDPLFFEALLAPPRELLPEPRLDALLDAPFDALLRDELLLPLLLARLLALLRPLLDFRAADLREPDFREDEREDEPPVREPAPRLELLRDDFFVAMLDSETRWGGPAT